MVWTQFMDMHSGGGTKTDYECVYIEAPEEDAINIFKRVFDEDPLDTACSCCGSNFSITEHESLEQATGYERGCKYAYLDEEGNEIPRDQAWIIGKGITEKVHWKGYVEEPDPESSYKKYIPLDEYIQQKKVKIIRKVNTE